MTKRIKAFRMMTLDTKMDIENMRKFAVIWENMNPVDKQVISQMFEQDKSIDYYCGFLASLSAVFKLLYDDLPSGAVKAETIQKVIRGSICLLANYIVERIE